MIRDTQEKTDFPAWPWNDAPPAQQQRLPRYPRITVVTPSFNQAEFVEATIRSVLLQRYENLEYIFMDGGSSDGTMAIIDTFKQSFAHWQSAPDEGQAAAIKAGFERSTGEILCWLNSDDILLPGALHRVAAEFLRHESVDVVYGNRIVIDRVGMPVGRHIWPRWLTRGHWAEGQPIAQECTFWRRALYEEVGGVDPSKFFVMDYDLFLRMWLQGRFRKTSAFLACYRDHELTKSSRHEDVRVTEIAAVQRLHGIKPWNRAERAVITRIDRFMKLLERRCSSDYREPEAPLLLP